MKRLFISLLILCLLLCGCAAPAVNTTVPATTVPPTTVPPTTVPPTTAAPETEPPTEPTTEPTTAPTESPVLYRSPLTGEPLDEPMTARPFAVMLNNVRQAMPLCGASEADIIYEVSMEGGLTRCMGVFSDIASVESLGSIRSARKYFVSLAMSYDAIYVHYGKSDLPGTDVGAQQYMDETGWNHMDGTSHGYPYFYENEDRKYDGYSAEHRHFLVGSRAVDYAKKNGFALTRSEPLDYGLQFAEDRIIVGDNAEKLTVWFNYGGTPSSHNKSTTLIYDSASGKYLSHQYGKENVDGNTGETLAFTNVLVLRTPTRRYQDTELLYVDVVGSGTGYYACNGQIIPIQWSRSSAYDPFVYTMENGTELTLSVGKTYVAVVPTKATVTYE